MKEGCRQQAVVRGKMQFNLQFGIASAPSSQLSWGPSERTMSAYDHKKSSALDKVGEHPLT